MPFDESKVAWMRIVIIEVQLCQVVPEWPMNTNVILETMNVLHHTYIIHSMVHHTTDKQPLMPSHSEKIDLERQCRARLYWCVCTKTTVNDAF